MASSIPAIFGAIGLGLAVFSIGPRLILRDLGRSTLQWVALALTCFTFVAIGFIVAGRTAQMRIAPGEVIAPRYLFWSSLFWAGLALIAIHKAETVRFLRWPVWVTLSALPLLVLPQHYQGAIWSRTVQLSMESAATSLINGVCDRTKVLVMYPNPSAVYNLAERFQRQRLDMFRSGMQDWIGISADELARKKRRAPLTSKGILVCKRPCNARAKHPPPASSAGRLNKNIRSQAKSSSSIHRGLFVAWRGLHRYLQPLIGNITCFVSPPVSF